MSERITVHPGNAREPTGSVLNDPGAGPRSKPPLTTRFGTAIAGSAADAAIMVAIRIPSTALAKRMAPFMSSCLTQEQGRNLVTHIFSREEEPDDFDVAPFRGCCRRMSCSRDADLSTRSAAKRSGG